MEDQYSNYLNSEMNSLQSKRIAKAEKEAKEKRDDQYALDDYLANIKAGE